MLKQSAEIPAELTPDVSEQSVAGGNDVPVKTSKRGMSFRSLSRFFSDDSLTKKASLNALASLLDYAARLLVGFLVTPIMVSGLGDFYYGVWQILTRLVSYLTPASGRPTQALKMTLANQQASTDYDLKRRHVGSTFAIVVLFTPLMIALGGVLTWYAPYWIKVPEPFMWYVRITAALLVANLILYNFVAIPASVVEGENLGYKAMGFSAALVLGGGGLTWLVLYLETGIIGVAVAFLVGTLIGGLFSLYVVYAYVPWFGVARPTLDAIRKFLDLSWWFVVWNLIMSLMLASDVVVLGIIQSAEAVTSYSLTKYAPETLISIIAIVAFGIAPGLGRIIGAGDLEKAAKVRNEIMALTWLIVTVLGASVLMWNRTFLTLWVGTKQYAGTLPNLLIIIVVAQLVFIRNDGNVIDLTLNLRRKVFMGALSVTISLIAAVALLSYAQMGIVGLSLGIILGRLIISIGYPAMIGRFLKVPFSAQVKGALRPAFVTALLFGATCVLSEWLSTSSWHGVSGWIQFILSCAVTFIVVLALAYYAGLSGSQRRQILRRVRVVLSRSSE